MMKFRISALIALSILLFSGTAFANTYLPDSVGNTWTYKSGTSTETVEISNSTSNWRLYDNFAGLGQQWIWTSSNYTSVWGWTSSQGSMKLFDTSDPVGTSYSTDISHCGPETIRIGAKDLSVRTPAGSFDNVLRLDMKSQCRDAGTSTIWLAPDAGVVKWSEITIAGPVVYEFASGTVDGVDYPKESAPLTITMAPSRDSLYLNLMPGPGAGTRNHDTSVSTQLTLANTGDRQIDFKFPSGQRFDIIVKEPNGNIVKTWSATRSFIQATSTVSLKPGEDVSYEGTIDLPAKEGRYILRMEVTSTNRHVAAETSVEITAVY